jgi:ComF family protein
MMNMIGTRVVDTLLPARCPVSGDLVEEQGMLSPQIWRDIDFIADPYCDHCGIPFEYEVENTSHCASCLAHPPPFKSARSAVFYNDASRNIILGFKHADKTLLVKVMTPWLQVAAKDMLKTADIIVPVPLHPFRLLMRRYNQAALLASALSQASKTPYSPNVLHRRKNTRSQGHLKSKDRYDNVKSAFHVPLKRRNDIKDKTVILIDDVFTTGATVKECTKTLLKAGAKDVHILTVARVCHGDALI